jgi:hypothetical protein
MRHKYTGPIAGDTTARGIVWMGYMCAHCGLIIRKSEAGTILSWAATFGGAWNKGKVPRCEEHK